MTYNEEVQQRRKKIQYDEREKWAKASQSCGKAIDEVISNLSKKAGEDAVEIQDWREWALQLLYGKAYWDNPSNHWPLPRDLRSSIEEMTKCRTHVAEVQRLAQENLQLKEQLARIKP